MCKREKGRSQSNNGFINLTHCARRQRLKGRWLSWNTRRITWQNRGCCFIGVPHYCHDQQRYCWQYVDNTCHCKQVLNMCSCPSALQPTKYKNSALTHCCCKITEVALAENPLALAAGVLQSFPSILAHNKETIIQTTFSYWYLTIGMMLNSFHQFSKLLQDDELFKMHWQHLPFIYMPCEGASTLEETACSPQNFCVVVPTAIWGSVTDVCVCVVNIPVLRWDSFVADVKSKISCSAATRTTVTEGSSLEFNWQKKWKTLKAETLKLVIHQVVPTNITST